MCLFLRNDKNGTSKNGLHFRDDSLMMIIRLIAVLEIERNTTSDSTLSQTRPDGYLYCEGLPPLVVFEEKHKDIELNEARENLRKKFFWLHHYHQLNFIIVIAIAGDTIEFAKISQHGMSSQVVFNLQTIDDRFRFVYFLKFF